MRPHDFQGKTTYNGTTGTGQTTRHSTSVRQGIAQADARGDRHTADMFTEISLGVDTYRWCVQAHLGLSACQETSACP